MADHGSAGAPPATRKLIHDLRQPLAAAQMWADLLSEAVRGQLGEKENRYLGKIRSELARLAGVLSVAASGVSTSEQSASAEAPAAPAPNASAPGDAAGPLAGVSLLIVEDDEMTAEALQLALEGEGATVVVAATIAAGLHSFAAMPPHVVLSDLRVSDGDGFTLVGEIRRRDQSDGRRTVAIAVTGFDGDDTRAASRAAGFDELVVKPFALADLIDTVTRLVAPVR